MQNEKNMTGTDAQPKQQGGHTESDKKQMRIVNIITISLAVAVGAYLLFFYLLGPKPAFTVNGKAISMRMTLQDLEDMGFAIVTDNRTHINTTGRMGAKQISSNSYQIGVPYGDGSRYELTGLIITPANFDSSSSGIMECSIYEIEYHPDFQSAAADVELAGKDLRHADVAEWADFFESEGYPFDKEELAEFRAGDKKQILGKRGAYKFQAYSWEYYDDLRFSNIKFIRNIEVEYKSR